MDHDDYLARRKELLGIRNSSFDSFDKAILTLSTGGLALSITFLDRIGKPFNRVTLMLILASWVGLGLVLVSNMLSFFFARWNMDKKLHELDALYLGSRSSRKRKDGKIEEKVFWQRKATEVCNYASVGLFLLSFSFFTVYVILIQGHRFGS